MTIELFTTAYNEALLLPYMVAFYRERVPHIVINVFDNGSTDNTVEIAESLGCIVHKFETGDQVRDDLLVNFKNNIWKTSLADWIVICDVDEWVDIKPEYLESATIIRAEGYDMVGEGEQPDKITKGVRYPMEDKVCVFDRRFIREINYDPGAHNCSPVGYLVYPSRPPKLFHMKYLSKEFITARYAELSKRMSDINNANGWGYQYNWSYEEVSKIFEQKAQTAIPIK